MEGLNSRSTNRKLGRAEADNRKHLKIIETYINRALDEYQKILSTHFDLKSMYTKELEHYHDVINKDFLFEMIHDPILQNP